MIGDPASVAVACYVCLDGPHSGTSFVVVREGFGLGPPRSQDAARALCREGSLHYGYREVPARIDSLDTHLGPAGTGNETGRSAVRYPDSVPLLERSVRVRDGAVPG